MTWEHCCFNAIFGASKQLLNHSLDIPKIKRNPHHPPTAPPNSHLLTCIMLVQRCCCLMECDKFPFGVFAVFEPNNYVFPLKWAEFPLIELPKFYKMLFKDHTRITMSTKDCNIKLMEAKVNRNVVSSKSRILRTLSFVQFNNLVCSGKFHVRINNLRE